MGYEPPLNDPTFYDDSDFVDCATCGKDFDYNLYQANDCEQCENKLMEQEKLKWKKLLLHK